MSDLRKHSLGERTTQWLHYAWFRGKFMPLKYFENKMTQFQRLAAFGLQQILTCEQFKTIDGVNFICDKSSCVENLTLRNSKNMTIVRLFLSKKKTSTLFCTFDVCLIYKKEIDTFVLPGCERHVKAWLGGLRPRYPKQNHDCEYKVDKLIKKPDCQSLNYCRGDESES